jgi:hypothetical protein
LLVPLNVVRLLTVAVFPATLLACARAGRLETSLPRKNCAPEFRHLAVWLRFIAARPGASSEED